MTETCQQATPNLGCIGVISITSAAQFPLHVIGRPLRAASAEADCQLCEPYQVSDTKERPPIADDDLRVRGDEVRPLRRNRANGLIVAPQQQPCAISVVPLAYANEPLPAQWMKRMRYPHKLRRGNWNTCILNRVTRSSRRTASPGLARSVTGWCSCRVVS